MNCHRRRADCHKRAEKRWAPRTYPNSRREIDFFSGGADHLGETHKLEWDDTKCDGLSSVSSPVHHLRHQKSPLISTKLFTFFPKLLNQRYILCRLQKKSCTWSIRAAEHVEQEGESRQEKTGQRGKERQVKTRQGNITQHITSQQNTTRQNNTQDSIIQDQHNARQHKTRWHKTTTNPR